jgi:hypothetical protein
MKKYASKHEIYQDYDLAIKLIIDGSVGADYYDRLIDAFQWDEGVKVLQLQQRIKNWNENDNYASVGFFVEVPAYGDTGDTIGTQFILLEHENGPEFFLHIVTNPQFINGLVVVMTYVTTKAFDTLYSQIQENALKKIGEKAGWIWQHLKDEVKISAVEIRTEKKGVARLKFSLFNINQIECLLDGFKTQPMKNIFDFNQQCFGGELVKPPSSE